MTTLVLRRKIDNIRLLINKLGTDGDDREKEKLEFALKQLNDLLSRSVPFDADGFVENQMSKAGIHADRQVLSFIAGILTATGDKEDDVDRILTMFRQFGYCYYFASILKTAFRRGRVCWAEPYGRFVWIDDKSGTPYDIGGVCTDKCDLVMPDTGFGDMLDNFLRIPGVGHEMTNEEIHECVRNYMRHMEIPQKEIDLTFVALVHEKWRTTP